MCAPVQSSQGSSRITGGEQAARSKESSGCPLRSLFTKVVGAVITAKNDVVRAYKFYPDGMFMTTGFLMAGIFGVTLGIAAANPVSIAFGLATIAMSVASMAFYAHLAKKWENLAQPG